MLLRTAPLSALNTVKSLYLYVYKLFNFSPHALVDVREGPVAALPSLQTLNPKPKP
jgi:hypothetical protein